MAAHSAGNFFFQAAERDAAHFHLGGNARHAEIDCAMTDVEKERGWLSRGAVSGRNGFRSDFRHFLDRQALEPRGDDVLNSEREEAPEGESSWDFSGSRELARQASSEEGMASPRSGAAEKGAPACRAGWALDWVSRHLR